MILWFILSYFIDIKSVIKSSNLFDFVVKIKVEMNQSICIADIKPLSDACSWRIVDIH